MKITAIKAQVKRVGRYSVFVDEKYAFSLSETALLESGIASGQELDQTRLSELKQLSATDKAYGRALNYLAIRARSEWEVQVYLRRKGMEAAEVEAIMAKLRRHNLLDDLAFARAWVENRRLLKPVSRRRLTQELRQKHLASDIIDQVLAQDSTEDRQTLRDLVDKKRQHSRYRADPTKLMQYLARQGYTYDDIKTVLNEEPAPDS